MQGQPDRSKHSFDALVAALNARNSVLAGLCQRNLALELKKINKELMARLSRQFQLARLSLFAGQGVSKLNLAQHLLQVILLNTFFSSLTEFALLYFQQKRIPRMNSQLSKLQVRAPARTIKSGKRSQWTSFPPGYTPAKIRVYSDSSSQRRTMLSSSRMNRSSRR
jgi:hypothetical protein